MRTLRFGVFSARPYEKYWAIFKTQLVSGFAYPLDLFSRGLSIAIFMWVFLHLWRATFASAGADRIGGLTLSDTIWYLLLAETLILSKSRLARSVAEAVKDGGIAYLLNKPFHFINYQLSIGLGDSLLRVAANLLAGGSVVWLTVGPPPISASLPLVGLAMILAWLIDFCLNALIGLLAFVTEDVSAFEWIYNKLILILGGVLIPLDFFPEWLRTISLSLPFAYTTYAPARLFVHPVPGEFVRLLAGQAFWLAVLAAALVVGYSRGVRRLEINGG